MHMRQDNTRAARSNHDSFSFQSADYDVDELDAWEEEASADRFYHDPNRLDVESIISVTARLAQVLAEEADYLADMKIKEIEKLQKEKNLLVDALEAQKRYVERNPHLLRTISDDEALEMAQIIEIFQKVMTENHRRLLIAKEVNQKVVEAIADVVTEAAGSGFYDKNGRSEASQRPVSVTINKTI